MERLYTDYTASGRQIVLNNVPTSFANITVENIRLIFNETQKDDKGDALDPLASTGAKENITNVEYDGEAHTVTITLEDSVPAIVNGDAITIKLDMGEGVDDIVVGIGSKLDEILAAIPTECSDADIDHMFETITEGGQIIVPSELITPEGTMPTGVFTAITGLIPVN